MSDTTLDGIELIAAERKRQIKKEGWTPEHDDAHSKGELAMAACCYALPESERTTFYTGLPIYWPWHISWWKPTPENRIRELAKAGALIAAEVDRLQRLRSGPR